MNSPTKRSEYRSLLSISVVLSLAIGVMATPPVAQAQQNKQTNTVDIPQITKAIAPSDANVSTTDYKDNQTSKSEFKVSDAATWNIVANNTGSATVEFSAPAFSTSSNDRNIKLEVASGQGAFSSAGGTTDTSSSGSEATVSVSSSSGFPNHGKISITSWFVHDSADSAPDGNWYAPEGTFTTTITATFTSP